MASPSLRILPPPRTGGGSIETTVQVGPEASTPSALSARSGISFFFAFMIPGSDGYRGSFSLLCTVASAGSGAFQTS